jgi:hypothetical protein
LALDFGPLSTNYTKIAPLLSIECNNLLTCEEIKENKHTKMATKQSINTESFDNGKSAQKEKYCDIWAVSRQQLGKHCLKSQNSNEQAEVHC